MTCNSGCCGPSRSPTFPNAAAMPLRIKNEGDSCCGNAADSIRSGVEESSRTCCGSVKKDASSDEDYPSSLHPPPDPGKVASCCEEDCYGSSCIDQPSLEDWTAERRDAPMSDSYSLGTDGNLSRHPTPRCQEQSASEENSLGPSPTERITGHEESCCGPSQQSPCRKKRFSSSSSIVSCCSDEHKTIEVINAAKASTTTELAGSCCASKATDYSCCSFETVQRGDSGYLITEAYQPSRSQTKVTVEPRNATENENSSRLKAASSYSTQYQNRPCASACCGVTIKTDLVKSDQHSCLNDIEAGRIGKEHVILSITGMTCTGCETKLSRTLATLQSITNLKTSLVLSRAQFDLDTRIQPLAEVIKHLERTTEFKCEPITNKGSSIELLYPGNQSKLIESEWPQGVIGIRTIDKSTIRVHFDAQIIGARDLVEKGWPKPMKLAPPRNDPSLDAGARHVRHVGYMTLLSIVLTIPILILSWAPLKNKKRKEILFGSISLTLATIIQFVVAGPFYPKALKALVFSRVIEMDLLIVLSTSTAYIFSVIAFGRIVERKPLATGEFFETSTLLVTLIMVGRYIAALARQKAVESISIRSLQTSSATLVHTDGTSFEEEIDARLLQHGDVFKVLPESRIPTDGTIISGFTEIDESMLTGESLPIEKSKGDVVIAGSINGSGPISVRLSCIPGDNTISRIADMVDDAKLSKPKMQEIADRVATFFVPVVVSLTLLVFCIWIAIGLTVQKKTGSDAAVQAIMYAITVLIVSCPCAIGLAVPMVIVVATGRAAEEGVVFKSADAIETSRKTSHVVFDKTGTLTEGKLSVVGCNSSNFHGSSKALLLGLINGSRHPVSLAVANHLRAEGVTPVGISQSKTVIGKGIEGIFAGRPLRAGNCRWLGVSEHDLVEPLLAQGQTVFCFTANNELLAAFGLEDTLRKDVHETVLQLQARNISVHVLSGDDDGAVRQVTNQLNICDNNVRSRCTPADKQKYIKELFTPPGTESLKLTQERPIVMFCGDGTNDAVALAEASVGIHLNEGSEVAKSAADVVFMRPNLSGVLTTIAISRKAYHRIIFNFTWSAVYNLFAILLAAGAFVHARIPPEYAGLGELVSVLPVIAMGVLLKWTKV